MEQRRCRDYILAGEDHQGDGMRGVWVGLSDWFYEELMLMEHETQTTIGWWGDDTFGTAYSAMVLGTRANTEMAELLRELAIMPNLGGFKDHPNVQPIKERVAMEAADVLVLLYRLAHVCGFDLQEALDAKMRVNRARYRGHESTNITEMAGD